MTFRDDVYRAVLDHRAAHAQANGGTPPILTRLLLHPEQRHALLASCTPSDGVTDGTRWRGMEIVTTVSNVATVQPPGTFDARPVALPGTKAVHYHASKPESDRHREETHAHP